MTLEVKKAYSTTMTSRCTAARETQKMGTKPQKKNAHRHTCVAGHVKLQSVSSEPGQVLCCEPYTL